MGRSLRLSRKLPILSEELHLQHPNISFYKPESLVLLKDTFRLALKIAQSLLDFRICSMAKS